ncbi:MAG: outer membrane-specific lipoprotein transporter subunit LolE [Methanosaeta sp. PtaB.Bin018]|mgnify:CR=1 FL=1|jgi:lipoprotein-releasing system permease protein|nr:ABC transporter permease [Methanothrix sp.]OPX74428.1 MAG: outer membrane-specific lipoprotein transporter subunit LolE [Methanosaeta sp. PtaB.Bin018]OPY43604.1 MAG: outer membrane-specific lipoprotein transporter subunit LolE [Methanosaeta sp. PtaU1.Bin016]
MILKNSLPVFELTVVARHITYRKWRTFLSVGAVALAVAISIVFISIQNGFSDFLFDIVFRFLPHITISPKEGEEYIHLYRGIVDVAWAIPGVLGVSPSLAATATLAYKDKAENVAMIGVDPVEADKISEINKYMVEGDIGSILGGKRIVMGLALAEKLKVKKGDTIQAKFPDAVPASLLVSGLFNFGYKQVDEAVTYVSLDTARDFLNEGDVVTSIDLKLEDPFGAEAAAKELRSYGYNAKDWQQLYPDIVRTLAFERTQNAITMLLLMIIATFGIASIMNMMVQEKTREIGMLMAMGASPVNIQRLFLLESGLLGLMGSILGCVLGFLVSMQLRGVQIQNAMGQMMNIPIAINPMDFVVFTILAVLLSIAAGYYPARKASRLDPVVALKG